MANRLIWVKLNWKNKGRFLNLKSKSSWGNLQLLYFYGIIPAIKFTYIIQTPVYQSVSSPLLVF